MRPNETKAPNSAAAAPGRLIAPAVAGAITTTTFFNHWRGRQATSSGHPGADRRASGRGAGAPARASAGPGPVRGRGSARRAVAEAGDMGALSPFGAPMAAPAYV